MRLWPDMFRMTSIKAKILGILGALAVCYLLLLAMVQLTATATHRHMEQVSTSLFPAALKIQEAEASFEQVKKRYKEAVLFEDPIALAGADKDSEAVTSALTALRDQVSQSPDLALPASELLTRFSDIRLRSHDTYGALMASKVNVSDDLQTRVAALATDSKRLTADMHALDLAIAGQFQDEFATIDSWSVRSRMTGWAMLMLGLMGFTGTWWVLQYKVVEPLENLAHRMQDIAQGDGDLTDRVDVRGHDELDEVGRWFNVFIGRIEQVVLRVTANAVALAEAAEGLAEIARETASQSALQQEQAMNITGSMGEISTAAYAISETTQKAAGDARSAEGIAHAGGETIQSTVAAIQQLLLANQATASKIKELGSASDAIGKIIHVIDEISNQCSLLALNASIEAARAGEHGRGFAVVAGEVRRLAESTSEATREIDRTVRAMQAGTAEVIQAMDASTRQVETGVASARSAGAALSNIIQGSEALQKMVTQIASASTEQSTAAHSVNANLNEIASLGARTTSSSARAVEACDRLSLLAMDLNQLVGSFKVREEMAGAAADQEDEEDQEDQMEYQDEEEVILAPALIKAPISHLQPLVLEAL